MKRAPIASGLGQAFAGAPQAIVLLAGMGEGNCRRLRNRLRLEILYHLRLYTVKRKRHLAMGQF
jgi:hypothetical protein